MIPDENQPVDIQALIRQHPAEVAEILSALSEDEALDLLHRLSRRKAASSVEEMDPDVGARLLSGMDRNEAVQILSRMAPDDAVDLLAELPPEAIQDILGRLSKHDSRELSDLLQYPEDSAGGLMSPEVIALPVDLTAAQAIEALRHKAYEAETVYYAYVVDSDRKLKGVLRLRDLVFAPPQTPIVRLITTDVRSVRADASAHDVASTLEKFGYLALPVVDAEEHLLGIVTHDDAMEYLRREDTGNILRLGGIPTGEEHPMSNPLISVRNRLPWMMANILFNIVAVMGVAVFQKSIAQITFLAVLMPIISDMGGNVATQAAAVAIRGLAVGQVEWLDFGRLLRKEALVGLMNGLVLGFEISLVAWFWRGNIFLGVIAAVSMWINTVFATVIGAAFPLLAHRARIDPAVMAGSVITTITDLTGFFLFLGFATAFIDRL